MYTFNKERDIDNQFDLTDVVVQVDSEATLTDMCEAFNGFLHACGYVFHGEVQIIEEDLGNDDLGLCECGENQSCQCRHPSDDNPANGDMPY